MNTLQGSAGTVHSTLLPYRGLTAVSAQIVLLASTVILPIAAHAVHAPIRMLLPMHWPVILAGLLYGWRAGAITGALAPLLSYLISGFPLPAILPSMTAELFAYGFVSGILREKFKADPFIGVGAAIIIGRIVFIVSVLVSGQASMSDTGYFYEALVPGFVAAFLQILLLPVLSSYFIHRHTRNESR